MKHQTPWRDGLGALPATDRSSEADVRALYIDLLKRALTHTLYWPPDHASVDEASSPEWIQAVRDAIQRGDSRGPEAMRTEGLDWPRFAQTMVGLRRLENVQFCVERALAEGIPGDFIEAGVWRGGVAIFMRGILRAYGITDRRVYAADSFRGLPPPDPASYPLDANDKHHLAKSLAISREKVERNFALYGLADDQVVFLEGWFRDTLPTLHDQTWAVVRIDGDLYESTSDALVNLYPRLSNGGYVIIDDFAHEACRAAVDDYRRANGIDEPIESIDWTGAFWRRR